MLSLTKAMERAGMTAPADQAAPAVRLAFDRSRWLPRAPADVYNELLAALCRVAVRVEEGLRFDPRPGARLLAEILDFPAQFVSELHRLTLTTVDQDEYLERHAVHVAVNGVLVGRLLELDRRTLLDTAVAGLYHDLGMYRLDRRLRAKAGPLDDGERAQILGHPDESARLLAGLGGPWQRVARLVAQEHERIDGSGYPAGRRQVATGAAIIGILDLFEALVNQRPYRNALSPADAAMLVVKEGKGRFPAPVIKAFVQLYSIYPVNSRVRLNNGAVATVVRANPAFPMKPVVQLERDPAGRLVRGRHLVDLAATSHLYVREVVKE